MLAGDNLMNGLTSLRTGEWRRRSLLWRNGCSIRPTMRQLDQVEPDCAVLRDGQSLDEQLSHYAVHLNYIRKTVGGHHVQDLVDENAS